MGMLHFEPFDAHVLLCRVILSYDPTAHILRPNSTTRFFADKLLRDISVLLLLAAYRREQLDSGRVSVLASTTFINS